LADRFSRSKVIISSIFIWSAVTWLTSRATTYEELVIARAAMGLSEACYIPAALALIADYHRGTTRAFAIGLHQSGISVGSSLGGLGGLLAENHSWTFPFQVFGIFGIVYSLLLLFIVRDPPRQAAITAQSDSAEPVNFWMALGNLLPNPRFLLLVACFSLMGLAGWAINGWMPTYLKEQFELGQGAAGMTATGYLHTAGFVGSIVGGVLSDYWIRFDARGRMLVPIIGLCIAGAGIMLAGTASVLMFAIFGLVAYGLCRHFADTNMMPILCIIANPRYRATGYGVLNLFSCLVGGIGIEIGGRIRDSDFDVSILFQIAAGGLVVAAILFWVIRPIEYVNTPGEGKSAH
jgi:MFS family permease